MGRAPRDTLISDHRLGKKLLRSGLGVGLRSERDGGESCQEARQWSYMGVQIQPRDIDVPEEDPFRNDLLDRKQPAEILSHLVGSIEGPCVIAVDAAWGNGKTTFLRLWAQRLRNEGFPVVEFNAWETDFSGDPFVALSTELTENLRGAEGTTLQKKIERTKKLAKEVLRTSIPIAIRGATFGILDIQVPIEKEIAQAVSSLAESTMPEYQRARAAFRGFRESLEDMANELAESHGQHPLVVVIDELDRCRPSYAVELLEAAKHLFAVDGVVFVLALNRSELSHSIGALYGGSFDATGYLRRFIDVDFRLPDPDRAAFIDRTLDAVRISEYFKRTADPNVSDDREEEVVRNWLKRFFGSPDFGLRRVSKAIHHLGLVFATLSSNERSFAITAVVALIVRTVDSDLYYKFVRGEATDLDVVGRVFERNPGLRELQEEHAGCMFETMIVLAAHEVSGDAGESIDSPLLKKYRERVGDEASDPRARKHAQCVIARLESLTRGEPVDSGTIGRRFGFKDSVQRLELLSPSLIGEWTKGASHQP